MSGVTTAIVAFILACLIFPQVIKNKPQYYAAVGLILLVILLDALAKVSGAGAFRNFAYLLSAVLQMGAVFLLILSAGGLTVKDLAGELADTFEVIRRGGEKEIIIPRRGETPRPRGARGDDDDDDKDRPARINLDAELRASHPPPPVAAPAPAPPPGQPKSGTDLPRDSEPDNDRSIPLA